MCQLTFFCLWGAVLLIYFIRDLIFNFLIHYNYKFKN